jgi:hypothetical protein
MFLTMVLRLWEVFLVAKMIGTESGAYTTDYSVRNGSSAHHDLDLPGASKGCLKHLYQALLSLVYGTKLGLKVYSSR